MEDVLQHFASFDSSGKSLEGAKIYKLHLPPKIPSSNFWSVIVYDSLSHLIISTDQSWPSIHSNSSKRFVNHDGSVDVWFGPETPDGDERNWIKTIPGKGWIVILRLYYPLESWFNKSWRPGEIEEIK